MTNHDDFFQQQQPAAVLKHALLREYTKVFASAVGSADPMRPIWVIDGYAGAGAYASPDPEGSHPDGSPLVVLKMAVATPGRDIRCVFIEADDKIAAQLMQNVRPFIKRGRDVTVLTGTVEQRLGDAWQLVGADPVVTFLDPFGVAMQAASMTDVLLGRPSTAKPSEVLVNINLEAVWRIGGNLEVVHGDVVPKTGQPGGVHRADAFFGGTWWRKDFLEARQTHGSAAKAAAKVVSRHREQIKERNGYDSISIPIRRRPGNEPLFLMTLFYRHPLAGYKFADAACRATRKWRDTYRRKELEDFMLARQQPSLLGDDFELEHSQEQTKVQEKQLEDELVSTICANIRTHGASTVPVAAHVSTILGATIGLAGERHIRLAWNTLADEGYLVERDTSQKLDRATMRRT